MAAIYIQTLVAFLFFATSLATPIPSNGTVKFSGLADKKDSPTTIEIRKDIEDRNKGPQKNYAVFYTGGGRGKENAATASRSFVNDHEDYIRLFDTDRNPAYYNDPNNWKDFDQVINRWSEAYARLSTGAVLVFFPGSIDNEIDSSRDSVWNNKEFPALTADGSGVDEIVQFSTPYPGQHTVIWPYDARKASDCKFVGDAPDCPTENPCTGTNEYSYAKSRWGDTQGSCKTGAKHFCCTTPVIHPPSPEPPM